MFLGREQRRSHAGRRSGFLLVAVASLAAAGCLNPLDNPFLPDADNPAHKVDGGGLSAGQTSKQITPGDLMEFEIDVPAGQALELIADPTRGATLGLARVTSPSGEVFEAPPGRFARSQDGDMGVEPRMLGERGVGLRFVGRASGGGAWKIAFAVVPSADLFALANRSRQRSLLENLLLMTYVFGGPDTPRLDLLAQLLQFSYPGIEALRQPVEIDLMVNVVEPEAVDPVDDNPGEPVPPIDGGDDSGGGNAGGDDDGGDDGTDDGGGDGNGGGDDGGSGDDGGGDDGGGSGGGDGDGGDDDPGVEPTELEVGVIAQTGDSVPGEALAARFTYFGNPIIDEAGRVAFWARFVNGRGAGGLFVYENGELTPVVTDNPNQSGTVPGKPTARFGNYSIAWDSGSMPMTWGPGGRLVFCSNVGTGTPNGIYRWRASDGDLIRVVDCDTLKTVFPNVGDTFLCEFIQPHISDDAQVLFVNRFTYFTLDNQFIFRELGVFSSNGVSTSVWRANRLKERVPDQGATFVTFRLLATLAGDGDVLFHGTYQNGQGNQGIYLGRGTKVYRVIDNRPSADFPGLPLGVQVGKRTPAFDGFAVGLGLRIAIDTNLTVGGETRDAVIVWDGDQWHELRGAGSASASALISGVNDDGQMFFLSDGQPYLGDGLSTATPLAGRLPPGLAGASDIQWESYGGAINSNGRGALRYRTGGNSPKFGLAFWTGSRLLLIADTALNLPRADLDVIFAAPRPDVGAIDRAGTQTSLPEFDHPGRSGLLNDLDQIVFRVGSAGPDRKTATGDDFQAVYLAKPKE